MCYKKIIVNDLLLVLKHLNLSLLKENKHGTLQQVVLSLLRNKIKILTDNLNYLATSLSHREQE